MTVHSLTKNQCEVFLETLQSNVRMPRHAPTVMFRCRGQDFVPVNPLAKAVCKLVGMRQLPDYKLKFVEDLGFSMEIANG